MTGGRWTPKTPTAPSSLFAVNGFATNTTVVGRLRALAPLHRRAALRRAAEACGALWPPPTLDDLATAEAPPAPVHRTVSRTVPLRPTRETVAAEAARVLSDLAWRAARSVESLAGRQFAAEMEATRRLTEAWKAGPTVETEVTNPEEVEHGRALAAAHGPLLAELARVLDGLDDVVPRSRLAAMADEDVCALAQERADAALSARAWRAALAAQAGRPVPEPTPADRRRACPRWQRARIRRDAGLARQHLAAALGTVGRGGAPYADDYSLARLRERREATVAWAAARVVRHRDGSVTPLPEVLDRAATASLARLGAVLHGLDDIAEAEGLVPVMVTLTLPPEWHPNPKKGRRSWTPDRGPEATDAAMRALWIRYRARCAKSGIAMLGIRVWEPHEDGSPHVHALQYVAADQVNEMDRHLRALCPEPVPPARDENGQVRRVASDLRVLDRGRAKPTTYVTKYLRKALSAGPGDGLDADQLDRHRATASEREWRRYGLLGVHGMQRAWQRLATAGDRELMGAPTRISAARAALNEARWADALTALGARATGDEPRVRLRYEDRTTAYGDVARRAVSLTADDAPGWTLPLSRGGVIEKAGVPEKNNDFNEVTVAVTLPRAGADAPAVAPGDVSATGDGYVYDTETGEILDYIDTSGAGPDPPTAHRGDDQDDDDEFSRLPLAA